MAYTRADIRNLIRDAIDPGSSSFANSQLDDWIEQAVIEVSPLLPILTTHTNASFTGSAVTLTGRAARVVSVYIDGEYWTPLKRTNPSFSGGNYYHIELDADSTELILGTAQTAVSITIIYHANTTQTDNDAAAFALADDHAPIIVFLVVAWAYVALHAQAIANGDELALISRHLTAAEDAAEEYYLALATAVEEEEIAQGALLL